MAPRIPPFVEKNRRLLLVCTGALLALWALSWAAYRFTHSITRDAFVASDLVNVAPQVAGAIVEVRVLEQDAVAKGQVLAVVDPSTYARRVESARARLAVEQASLRRAEIDLALLQASVPRRVQAADEKLQIAADDEQRAREALDMASRDAARRIQAAAHGVEAARAKLRMAEEDHARYKALSEEGSVPVRRFQEATRAYQVARSELKIAEAGLGMARADSDEQRMARQDLLAAGSRLRDARVERELAALGEMEIEAGRLRAAEQTQRAEQALRELQLAEILLAYTEILAPCDGVIARKWRHVGDYAHTGEPVFSMYDTRLLYVTANLDEKRLAGVRPGNRVRLDVAALDRPLRGRVLWVGTATDATFSLIPRDISSGEFTYVAQRVPVRIWIERDDRWPMLKPGLSVRAAIRHGPGDPAWAMETLRKEAGIERLGEVAP